MSAVEGFFTALPEGNRLGIVKSGEVGASVLGGRVSAALPGLARLGITGVAIGMGRGGSSTTRGAGAAIRCGMRTVFGSLTG